MTEKRWQSPNVGDSWTLAVNGVVLVWTALSSDGETWFGRPNAFGEVVRLSATDGRITSGALIFSAYRSAFDDRKA